MMDPDENIEVAKWAVEDGVDFVSVSIFGRCPTHITSKHKDQVNPKPLVQEFCEALPMDVVIMACGGVKSGEDVQTLLDMGIVAVTGGCPDFPNLVQKNKDYIRDVNPPFSEDHLKSVDVSPPFVDVLSNMGMVAKE